MTIRDFMEYAIEPALQEVMIWDCNEEKNIFEGDAYNIDEELMDLDVCSWNTDNNYIVFNVER